MPSFPWPADSLQAVVFFQPGARQEDALTLWAKAFDGETPDAFQKPAPASPTLHSSASGQREDLSMNIAVQVGRVDILFTPTHEQVVAAPQGTTVRIDRVPDRLRILNKVIAAIIKGSDVVRLAVIADLSRTEQAGQEPEAFRSALPMLALPATGTDFIFQINVRKSFRSVSDLPMNRLLQWSTGQIGVFVPPPGAPVMIPGAQVLNKVEMVPYFGLKIDVNSAPEHKIPQGSASEVLSELIDEVIRIGSGDYAEMFDG